MVSNTVTDRVFIPIVLILSIITPALGWETTVIDMKQAIQLRFANLRATSPENDGVGLAAVCSRGSQTVSVVATWPPTRDFSVIPGDIADLVIAGHIVDMDITENDSGGSRGESSPMSVDDALSLLQSATPDNIAFMGRPLRIRTDSFDTAVTEFRAACGFDRQN